MPFGYTPELRPELPTVKLPTGRCLLPFSLLPEIGSSGNSLRSLPRVPSADFVAFFSSSFPLSFVFVLFPVGCFFCLPMDRSHSRVFDSTHLRGLPLCFSSSLLTSYPSSRKNRLLILEDGSADLRYTFFFSFLVSHFNKINQMNMFHAMCSSMSNYYYINSFVFFLNVPLFGSSIFLIFRVYEVGLKMVTVWKQN